MAKINVKIKQKSHNGDGPYFAGAGMYFGFKFEQLGEDLVASVEDDAIESLVDAKKVTKISAAVYKEMIAEAKDADKKAK